MNPGLAPRQVPGAAAPDPARGGAFPPDPPIPGRGARREAATLRDRENEADGRVRWSTFAVA